MNAELQTGGGHGVAKGRENQAADVSAFYLNSGKKSERTRVRCYEIRGEGQGEGMHLPGFFPWCLP